MPPKARINKDMIIDAAFDIIRNEGIEKLTVRSISDKLHCSTQPILYNYATIDDIKKEVYQKVDQYHSEFILPKGNTDMEPLLELGLNYVRFGYEEKYLFQFLFQTNQFSGLKMDDLLENAGLTDIIWLVSRGAGISLEAAKDLFLSLFVTAHGIASLLVGNAMEYEEELIINLLLNPLKNFKRY